MPRDEAPTRPARDGEETPPKYTGKIPKTLGGCADRLFAIRAEKSAAAAVVRALQAEETALKDHIVENLPKGDTGAAGALARVTVNRSVVPQVVDWDAFWAWVKKGKGPERFRFLQKRISTEPIVEMLETGKQVPGVGTFGVAKVSVNKL